MNEPTLFDQLRESDQRFGTSGHTLCPVDVELIGVWAEVGIPADLSTVEHACELLMALWRERSTWLGLLDELGEVA